MFKKSSAVYLNIDTLERFESPPPEGTPHWLITDMSAGDFLALQKALMGVSDDRDKKGLTVFEFKIMMILGSVWKVDGNGDKTPWIGMLCHMAYPDQDWSKCGNIRLFINQLGPNRYYDLFGYATDQIDSSLVNTLYDMVVELTPATLNAQDLLKKNSISTKEESQEQTTLPSLSSSAVGGVVNSNT